MATSHDAQRSGNTFAEHAVGLPLKALKQPFTSQIQVRCGEEQAANLNLTGEDDGVYAISNDVTERKYWEGPGSSVRFVYLLATSRASTVCL